MKELKSAPEVKSAIAARCHGESRRVGRRSDVSAFDTCSVVEKCQFSIPILLVLAVISLR